MFLAKIKLGNSKERSEAQRQAVNSICQVVFLVLVYAWMGVVEDWGGGFCC